MANVYAGKVIEKEKNPYSQFSWLSLIIWVASLLLSLFPTGISMLIHFANDGKIDMNFWMECFIKNDTMWTFATVLLFSIMSYLLRKRKNALSILSVLGIVLFVIMEGFWICCKYIIPLQDGDVWPVGWCFGFIILSLVLATPLQIDFRKRGEK